jgi:cysteine synthase A
MKIYKNALELIGKTPLVELSKITEMFSLKANIYGKFEAMNPSGSVKDRAAYGMLKKALDEGIINENTKIIEPTSGNTGIGLALIGAVLGLKVTLVLPETMSVERRNILKAYGADLVLTEGAKGMKGAIAKAEELIAQNKNAFMPHQFDNAANATAHYNTTGPEIYEDTDGNVDYVISAVGSAGTISGVGKYLKGKNPKIKIIAVEAASSSVLSGNKPGAHKIQGISAGFIPTIYDSSVVDEIIQVSDDDAFSNGRLLAQKEGLFVGISSGAALTGAIKIAQREESNGKNIVVILPDSGDRYLSTPLYHQD